MASNVMLWGQEKQKLVEDELVQGYSLPELSVCQRQFQRISNADDRGSKHTPMCERRVEKT